MIRGFWIAAMMGAATAAQADYGSKPVGNWIVSAKEDRFGDGGMFTAATGDGTYILIIRCLQKKLSIAVMEAGPDPKPLTEGALFAFKFKVDKQPVVETAGEAISGRLIQLDTEKSLVKAIRGGKETALRMENVQGVSMTHVFRTAGAGQAFADLSKECPLD